MSDGVFTCHGVEWLAGDTCAFCEVISETEQRIIELLEAESRDIAIDDIYDGVMYGFIKRAEFKKRLIALIKGEGENK